MPLRSGFTLLELLVAIAVAGVFVGLVMPTFDSLLLDNRRTARINNLVTALHLARSEAIKRGKVVAICPTGGTDNCAGSDAGWEHGWLVFANLDRDDPPRIDDDEPVLFRYSADRHAQIRANRRAFTYRPFDKNSTNGTIVFCDRRGAAHARAVVISYTGRPRIADKSASGGALTCPD